jgi:hypothetical protein
MHWYEQYRGRYADAWFPDASTNVKSGALAVSSPLHLAHSSLLHDLATSKSPTEAARDTDTMVSIQRQLGFWLIAVTSAPACAHLPHTNVSLGHISPALDYRHLPRGFPQSLSAPA